MLATGMPMINAIGTSLLSVGVFGLATALNGRVANTSGGSYHPAKAGIFMLC